MFSRLKDFASRHKKKIIGTGIIIGGVIALTRYAKWKIQKWQEKETREFLERTQRQYHFENMERTCNQTVLSLSSTLFEVISRNVDTDSSVNLLNDSPADKVSVWNNLKIQLFTRVAILVYAGAMLVTTLRIQINLVGGYMCQNYVGGDSANCVTSELQHTYLNLCRHFLSSGIMELCKIIEEKVKLVVETIPLSRKLKLQETEQLFWAIHSSVANADNSDPVRHLSHYVLPPQNEFFRTCHLKPEGIELLEKMFSETLDLLESEEVLSVVSSCVNQGFSTVISHISKFYSTQNKADLNVPLLDTACDEPKAGPSWLTDRTGSLNNGDGFVSSHVFPLNSGITIPMAKLLPIINGIVQNPNTNDFLSLWIKPHIDNDKLKLLGANVYEAFSYKV